MIAIEERHLAIVKNILSQCPYIFYAFGSRALGKAKKFSDLDLCFFEAISQNIRIKLEEAFEESDLPYKVDLVDWNTCDDEFKIILNRDIVCLQASPLLLKIEQNVLAHFKYFPSLIEGAVHENELMTIINCGMGSSMFNIVFGTPSLGEQDVEQAIQKIIHTFNGQPFAWWIPPSLRSNEFKQRLLATGFSIEAAEYAMICELDSLNDELQNNSFHVKQVLHKDQLEDFINILEPYDKTARRLYETLNISMLQKQENLFVGYVQDSPAIIGILFQQENTASIFSLLTSEHYRRQGLGTTMMRHLMKTAKENGARYVTLSASSDSGYRIYQRLNFNVLGQFECFEWKGIQ